MAQQKKPGGFRTQQEHNKWLDKATGTNPSISAEAAILVSEGKLPEATAKKMFKANKDYNKKSAEDFGKSVLKKITDEDKKKVAKGGPNHAKLADSYLTRKIEKDKEKKEGKRRLEFEAQAKGVAAQIAALKDSQKGTKVGWIEMQGLIKKLTSLQKELVNSKGTADDEKRVGELVDKIQASMDKSRLVDIMEAVQELGEKNYEKAKESQEYFQDLKKDFKEKLKDIGHSLLGKVGIGRFNLDNAIKLGKGVGRFVSQASTAIGTHRDKKQFNTVPVNLGSTGSEKYDEREETVATRDTRKSAEIPAETRMYREKTLAVLTELVKAKDKEGDGKEGGMFDGIKTFLTGIAGGVVTGVLSKVDLVIKSLLSLVKGPVAATAAKAAVVTAAADVTLRAVNHFRPKDKDDTGSVNASDGILSTMKKRFTGEFVPSSAKKGTDQLLAAGAAVSNATSYALSGFSTEAADARKAKGESSWTWGHNANQEKEQKDKINSQVKAGATWTVENAAIIKKRYGIDVPVIASSTVPVMSSKSSSTGSVGGSSGSAPSPASDTSAAPSSNASPASPSPASSTTASSTGFVTPEKPSESAPSGGQGNSSGKGKPSAGGISMPKIGTADIPYFSTVDGSLLAINIGALAGM